MVSNELGKWAQGGYDLTNTPGNSPLGQDDSEVLRPEQFSFILT